MRDFWVLDILFTDLIFCASCEVNNEKSEPVTGKDSILVIRPDPEYYFKIGDNLYSRYSDIELYDSFTRINHFKTNHHEFEKYSRPYFPVIVKSDTVYKGDSWPLFRLYAPQWIIPETDPSCSRIMKSGL